MCNIAHVNVTKSGNFLLKNNNYLLKRYIFIIKCTSSNANLLELCYQVTCFFANQSGP